MKWLYNQKFIASASQFSFLAILVLLLFWGINNAAINLEKAGIASGFGFLHEIAGFDIAQTLIPYDRNSTYLDAFFVGLLNTILVSVLAIFFSTIIGFFMGVARLSDNFLLRNLASVYIGSIRNFPLLLQILFWYIAVLSPLPGPRQAIEVIDNFFLSNRGLIAPSPIFLEGSSYFLTGVFITVIISFFFIIFAKRYQQRTGKQIPAYIISLIFIVLSSIGLFYLLSRPIKWDNPALSGFNFKGGFTILPELIALLLALSCYASAFIAENVRAGILAIDKGQKEAALSLGLSSAKIMRLIILPQALRIIIPPLTSQHLTTVKNSSLAVVIGYPELVHVFAGTTLNQSGQVVEIIAITIAVYLFISLSISLLMNLYNRSILIKER